MTKTSVTFLAKSSVTGIKSKKTNVKKKKKKRLLILCRNMQRNETRRYETRFWGQLSAGMEG